MTARPSDAMLRWLRSARPDGWLSRNQASPYLRRRGVELGWVHQSAGPRHLRYFITPAGRAAVAQADEEGR